MIKCNAAAKRPQGFTLIEMLIVLLIMGLMVGLVSVIVQPDDRALLRIEADRLAQLLDLAVAESRLSGHAIAWTAEGPGYRFWRMSGDAEWLELRDSDLLRARTLPQGMSISALQVENVPVNGVKRLEFAPQGLTHAFTIGLSFGAARCAVAASPIGEVRVISDDGQSNCGAAPNR